MRPQGRVGAEIYKSMDRPAVWLDVEWEGKEGTESHALASCVPDSVEVLSLDSPTVTVTSALTQFQAAFPDQAFTDHVLSTGIGSCSAVFLIFLFTALATVILNYHYLISRQKYTLVFNLPQAYAKRQD